MMSTAILVIDLQVGLFEESGLPYDYEAVIGRINRITTAARSKCLPVVFVQHELAQRPLMYKSPGWALVDDLVVEPGDCVVRKTTPNSFLNTDLTDILVKQKVEELIVCGYATEYCVDTTVRAAAALGYSIKIAADAHTTHEKDHATAKKIREHHNQTLSRIKSFGVAINALDTAEILIMLAD